MKKKMKRINTYITNKQYEQIKKEAEEKEITFSEMLRKIIERYIENGKT